MPKKEIKTKAMHQQEKLRTKLFLSFKTKTILLFIIGVMIITPLWIISLLNSTSKNLALLINDKNITTHLDVPLIDFQIIEEEGLTISSDGSIKNMTATMDGTMVGWKTTKETESVSDLIKGLNGLIGYWKLDNSLIDSSIKNNLAIAYGNLSCNNNPGYINNGCTFGIKDQYLDISSIDKHFNPQSGTILAWVYPTASNSNSYIIQGVGSNSDRYYIQWASNRLRVVRGDNGATITLASNVQHNNWYHVAISWDENNIYGYLNGELRGSTQYSSPFSTNPRFRIGNQAHATENRSFPGNIDEVAFFNRKLEGEEVSVIYNYYKTLEDSDNQEKFLYFNNNDSNAYGRLRINNHSEIQKLNLKNKITISAEIYLTQYPTSVNQPYTIYTDSTILSNGNALTILPNGIVRAYANTGNTRYIFTANKSKVPLKQWVQITSSFNAETEEMIIVVDSNEYGTDKPGKTLNVNRSFTTRPIIGMSGSWRNGFRGFIKNVKVWDRTLANGQYLTNYLKKIKDGFNTDLAGKGKAKWLGEGKLEITHINIYPDVTFIYGSEDSILIEQKISFDEVAVTRSSQSISNIKTTSWAAWADQEGIINLFIYSPLEETEKQAILALEEFDWAVDIKNFIGPSRFNPSWIIKNKTNFSHLFLGSLENPENSKKTLEDIFKSLQNLKIFNNIIFK